MDAARVGDVVALLDNPTIRITMTSTTWSHQVLLYGLVDLLGRIFPRLDVAVEDAAAAAGLPPGGHTVTERIAAIRARSPLAPLPAVAEAVTIHVGPGDDPADVYVDASEWQSYLGTRPSRLIAPRRNTAVGPLAAACRAGARVYSHLLRSIITLPAAGDEVYMSALTYTTGSDPLSDPVPARTGLLDSLLVGAGSVGGAAGYTFAYEPDLTGRIGVCDPDHLDDTNPFRSMLATAAAAAANAAKVEEFAAALVHQTGLDVIDHQMSITDWEAEQPGQTALPLVLVAVDSRESRERIQDALPLNLVNAAVGGDIVVVSGHRTGCGPCVCCLHMPDVLDAKRIKNRLIADATGIPLHEVNVMRVTEQRLNEFHLRRIEARRGLARGALGHRVGATVDELYNADLLYGEMPATTGEGTTVAVASPFVTALAGVLLAGEALKHSTPELAAYALGPGGAAVAYRENVFEPDHAYTDPALPRAEVCLCRSVQRLRVLADLHNLDLAALTG